MTFHRSAQQAAEAARNTIQATTRDELIEYLHHLNGHAKRQPYVVEPLSTDRPTSWTRVHRKINEALDLLGICDG